MTRMFSVLCIDYENIAGKTIGLLARKTALKNKVLQAIEHQRQKSALSPDDVNANYLTLDATRISCR